MPSYTLQTDNSVDIFSSCGTIKYTGDKCFLEIDSALSNYYYSLIPKYYYPNRPVYKPHITIIRSGIEKIKQNYGMWSGLVIPFYYYPPIRQDKTYFCLDIFSLHIGLLRKHLGLTWFRNGFNSFHLTISNRKTK